MLNINNKNIKRGIVRTLKSYMFESEPVVISFKSCIIENEPVAISFVAGNGKVPVMKSLSSFKVCPILEIKGK